MDCDHNSNNNNYAVTSNIPMTTWSQCELQSLKDAFVLLDTGKSGEIFVYELRQTLEELRQLKNDKRHGRNINGLLISLETFDPETTLSLNDFLSLLTSPHPNFLNDDVEKVFDLFDVDGKGYINMDNLRVVAKGLGEINVSDAELHEMIQRVSSSGRVTLDQFRDIMNSDCLI